MVGDLNMAVIEAGPVNGPLVLCLHGFPDSASTWVDVVDRLGEFGFHAVTPFQRGYAPTGPAPDDCYHVAALATDVLTLHRVLEGDDRAVVIGHDWGAAAAYAAMSAAPGTFRRAVTMSVPPTGSASIDTASVAQMQRSWYAFMLAFDWASELLSRNDFALIDQLWAEWAPGLSAAAVVPLVKQALRPAGCAAAATHYYRDAMQELPLPERYSAVYDALDRPITTPTLYLHGAADGCIDPSLASLASAALPAGSKVEILDGVGHFPHLEDPRFVTRIQSWVT